MTSQAALSKRLKDSIPVMNLSVLGSHAIADQNNTKLKNL